MAASKSAHGGVVAAHALLSVGGLSCNLHVEVYAMWTFRVKFSLFFHTPPNGWNCDAAIFFSASVGEIPKSLANPSIT